MKIPKSIRILMKPESYHSGALFFVLRKTLTTSYCNYVPGDLDVPATKFQQVERWNERGALLTFNK